MGIVIKLTESQLKEVIKNVIKEDVSNVNDVVPCSSIGVKTIGYCNKKTGKPAKYVPCSLINVKYSGFCEFKTGKPVDLCSKLGVKSPGICYVHSKEPVPPLK